MIGLAPISKHSNVEFDLKFAVFQVKHETFPVSNMQLGMIENYFQYMAGLFPNHAEEECYI